MSAPARAWRTLPEVEPELARRLLREIDERPLRYALGSGQGDEIAVACGLKPLFRQLLSPADLERQRRRCEGERKHTAVSPPSMGNVAGDRQVLFVSPERARVEEAKRLELIKLPDAGTTRAMGELLGYPACCVEAFVECPPSRTTGVLCARALSRTRGAPRPRLNVMDLAVFHLISWYPCSFECEPSRAYADALAAQIGREHGAFLRQIEGALGAHRLQLFEGIQLSIRGGRDGAAVRPEQVWATARDRHPDVALGPDEREGVCRALALVGRARTVEVRSGTLFLDGAAVDGTREALLVPFGG